MRFTRSKYVPRAVGALKGKLAALGAKAPLDRTYGTQQPLAMRRQATACRRPKGAASGVH
jgi:hypothetical protein